MVMCACVKGIVCYYICKHIAIYLHGVRCDGDQVLAVPDRVVKEVKAHPRHSLQLGQTVSAV